MNKKTLKPDPSGAMKSLAFRLKRDAELAKKQTAMERRLIATLGSQIAKMKAMIRDAKKSQGVLAGLRRDVARQKKVSAAEAKALRRIYGKFAASDGLLRTFDGKPKPKPKKK